MTFDLLSFLNAANPVMTLAVPQPGPDGLMRHGIALIGLEGVRSIKEALRDQAQLPDTYLAVYLASKDDMDSAGKVFNEAYAMTLPCFTFSGNLLVYKPSYDNNARYQYRELYLDGLLSGHDYYYGIKLFVAGIAQPGFNKGAFTTHGTAYAAPDLAKLRMTQPSDDYKLAYNLLYHDMSGTTGVVPRFEVTNSVLSSASPRPVIVLRDNYDPERPGTFYIEEQPGGIFSRYVAYDVAIRYVSASGAPVGVSKPTYLARNVQIPWLHNFVDEVVLKGGGVDAELLKDAAAMMGSLTPAEVERILEMLEDGSLTEAGSAYQWVLKQAALKTLTPLVPLCDSMRAKLRDLLYRVTVHKTAKQGSYITFDPKTADATRVFRMITAPSSVRGYNLDAFVKFGEGVFYVGADVDSAGKPTSLTRVTYLGQAAVERFFVDFNNRRA